MLNVSGFKNYNGKYYGQGQRAIKTRIREHLAHTKCSKSDKIGYGSHIFRFLDIPLIRVN